MSMTDSPLLRAMAENGTEAGAEPLTLGADEWVARLAELPLALHPGEGWRYHYSFGLLGILLARQTGQPLDEHLAEDLFVPLGMIGTALSVPEEKLDRLPAATDMARTDWSRQNRPEVASTPGPRLST